MWRPAADAVRGVVALLRSAPDGVNTSDLEGCTLLHRLALAGHARCLELLLQLAPPAEGADADSGGPLVLDLLVRTRTGANALQLARQARHAACVALLEGATQRAAEARQAALLAELDEAEAEEGGAAGGRKGKKKKASRARRRRLRRCQQAPRWPRARPLCLFLPPRSWPRRRFPAQSAYARLSRLLVAPPPTSPAPLDPRLDSTYKAVRCQQASSTQIGIGCHPIPRRP